MYSCIISDDLLTIFGTRYFQHRKSQLSRQVKIITLDQQNNLTTISNSRFLSPNHKWQKKQETNSQ